MMPVPAETVEIKNAQELAAMREAGAILGAALGVVAKSASAGISTFELDRIAETEIRKRKAQPAFLNYRGFPAALCVSVDSEVVHGIPRKDKILKEGDIVSLDLGCILRGYYADAAVTVPVGKVSPKAADLVETARRALQKGIEQMRPGNRVGDISHAVQSCVESKGYSVVRTFVGHGIGRALHEAPPVANYGRAGSGPRLAAGMVLAVEPMVNMLGPDVRILDDGWTAVTTDGGWSAHFEHTVAITDSGPEILTELQ